MPSPRVVYSLPVRRSINNALSIDWGTTIIGQRHLFGRGGFRDRNLPLDWRLEEIEEGYSQRDPTA